MGSSITLARVSPWALIAAALLMGAALLATVWTTHRGVLDASKTLERGQAGVLGEGIRTRLASLETVPGQADLEDLLDDLDPEGLTFVALFDRKGTLQAKAGESLGQLAELQKLVTDRQPFTVIPIGDRRRVVLRGALRRGWRRAATSAQLGEHRPGLLVIEFRPRIAEDLRGAAGQTLLIGAIAAGGLLLAALGLFRWILRREAEGRTLEHERRLASLGQMSAVLAHEIRNPLASLKGNAQLLARALPEGEKSRTKADRVVGEAIRLETLTNDLLEFARTGAIQREPIDPIALLREAAVEVGGDRIEVAVAGAPDAWQLDRPRIRQVLTNLLDNAVQSTEAGSRVEAGVGREGNCLVYVVRDHGPGIAEDDLPRLFEPFFSRRTQGTGLGLAVSKRLVELHGGSIQARNLPGGGAEFSVSLPKA